MGREARRVPPDWRHPLSAGTYPETDADWQRDGRGFRPRPFRFDALLDYSDYQAYVLDAIEDGDEPTDDDCFMPNWTPEEATHWQMYETCSEGTPISPVCDTPEALAQWCVDNKASTFAYDNYQDYDTWMRIILGADAYLIYSQDKGLRVEVLG